MCGLSSARGDVRSLVTALILGDRLCRVARKLKHDGLDRGH